MAKGKKGEKVAVVKGKKKMLEYIAFEVKSNNRLGYRVAFQINTYGGKEIVNYFEAKYS